MLHIREISDLHLEFDYEFLNGGLGYAKEKVNELLPPLTTDKKTVLIVAGDLTTASRAQRASLFFSLVLPRFKHCIYVLGNHEHYGMDLNDTLPTIQRVFKNDLKPTLLKKLTVVGNEPIKLEIGGITFLCGTMWTDYGKHRTQKDEVRRLVSQYINDHRGGIKLGKGTFTCADGQSIFDSTVAQFDQWMTKLGDNKKTVIVTHHMPTFQAVHPQYCTDEMTRMVNHAFASNCEDLMLRHQPALWFFGHTHIAWYGEIGKTQLHCNPYGYPHESTAARGSYDSTRVYTL